MEPEEIENTFITEPHLRANDLIAPKKQRESFRAGLNSIVRALSPSERLFLYILSIILGASAFALLAQVNTLVSTEVPTRGGSLSEGAVGTPRFINPLLAVSNADQDLTMLVYSGLLRANAQNDYVPDLAEDYTISEDGTVYTFHLRKNRTFHDGTPLRAKDVLFTVALAQNPEIKSPRRADWEGVVAQAPDEYTVVFTLPHAYAPFRENTTLGIVPSHLWENVAADEFPYNTLNTHPIGSGPYRVHDSLLDETGAPSRYNLVAFDDFALGSPHIGRLSYLVYANDDDVLRAYESGSIDSFVATSPKNLPRELQESSDVRRASLARVFGVFMNQNHAPVLANAAVRAALEAAVDKDAIIEKVLGGYGTVLNEPVPPQLLPHREDVMASTSATSSDRSERAKHILMRGGWKFSSTATTSPSAPNAGFWTKDKTELSLSLATADIEDLVATAHAVADAWSAVGITTSVHVYPLSEFNATILRPRAYDAILFGEVVGRSLDLFAFWHSSQRNDPGLNLALYTNAQADKLLASARAESDLEKRQIFLREFVETLDKEAPSVFLYSPQVAYVIPSRVKGAVIPTLTSPADRFVSIYEWYRDTERVWNIFRDSF